MIQFIILTVCSVLIGAQAELSGKIVGGDYARIQDFSHAVFLQVVCKGESYIWICGSSIINEKMLLTAAHCLDGCEGYPQRPEYLDVVAGTANLQQPGGVVRRTKNFKPHERFDTHLSICDIGLVGVDKGLPFGNNIKRIIIPQSFPNERYFYTAGWGVTNERTGATDEKLKSVKQMLSNSRDCGRWATSNRLCVTHVRSHKEYPSSGDSGSGLVTSDFKIVGLVSFTLLKNPEIVIYTNVTSFYDWIMVNSRYLYCGK